MIDAKEIKIGNWFEHNEKWCYRRNGTETNKFYFQWNESDWYALGECTLFLEDISPIPLTTELLEKIGFKKGNFNNEYKWQIKTTAANFGFFDFDEKINGKYYFWTVQKVVELKHLHQLQNLYYALTQKELEIKL